MKKLLALLLPALLLFKVQGQTPDYSAIDKMIVFGNFDKAVDTCRLILSSDSANAEIWYKMGLASRNLLPDTGSFNCFLKAATFDPVNDLYKFTVAKGYFDKNKNQRAKPILKELVEKDSMNWSYAFYLTGIFIEENRYDDAIKIYNRFYSKDTANYVILDKLGYANLKKGKYREAIGFYNKSMAIFGKNIDAIRNLSFLYPYVNKMDTAITLLDKAIALDPDDVDLYARRATIFWAKHYNKRALNDYLKILSLGDSSVLYLKRAGICYVNNLQHRESVKYLLKATMKDTTDFETMNYLANSYYSINNLKQSQLYYHKVLDLLSPFPSQMAYTHMMLGEVYKDDGKYSEAIDNYMKCQKYDPKISVSMMIANIYDEKLNDMPKAITYYKRFLSEYKTSGVPYPEEYIKNIKERLAFLEAKQAEGKNVPVQGKK
ncbi:MAG TPA: tetratricopeptide repeat protein [Bacteroidales bacterium]|nr:tetratricopeptide repeat protein [Bacteroidales bacterium]